MSDSVRTTGRGFRLYGDVDVVDDYHNTIRVQESSVGTHVWIFANDPEGRDFVPHPPSSTGISVRSPHLSPSQAAGVAARLVEFLADVEDEELTEKAGYLFALAERLEAKERARREREEASHEQG